MEVGSDEILCNAHFYLMPLDIGKGPLDRLFHSAVESARHFQFACAGGAADFQTIHTDFSLGVDRTRVDRTRRYGIRRNQIPTAFSGTPTETLEVNSPFNFSARINQAIPDLASSRLAKSGTKFGSTATAYRSPKPESISAMPAKASIAIHQKTGVYLRDDY